MKGENLVIHEWLHIVCIMSELQNSSLSFWIFPQLVIISFPQQQISLSLSLPFNHIAPLLHFLYFLIYWLILWNNSGLMHITVYQDRFPLHLHISLSTFILLNFSWSCIFISTDSLSSSHSLLLNYFLLRGSCLLSNLSVLILNTAIFPHVNSGH